MSIYTKKGDGGETGLPGKRRLPKSDLIFEVLGSLDQTNALIGLAITLIDQKREKELIHFLETIQSDLLSIGSTIASEEPLSSNTLTTLDKRTLELEAHIDSWDSQLPELKNFILPGGSQASSVMHLARASTRQAERAFHRLPSDTRPAMAAMFLNRLSDYFFQCARYLNMRANKPDIIWKTSN
ncbi:MAG: cob(I)yrinic acid a,c-diamide adenosyltransferase [Patescibacteria group bacterium]